MSVWSKWNRPPNALIPFAAPDKGEETDMGQVSNLIKFRSQVSNLIRFRSLQWAPNVDYLPLPQIQYFNALPETENNQRKKLVYI